MSKFSKRTHFSERGVTLVEVVIAMAIILIVGLGCVQVLQFNSRASLTTFQKIQANQYLEQIHNRLRRSNVAKLEEHYQQFPQIILNNAFSAEVQIEKPVEDQSRQAKITVRWNSNNAEESISDVVTLVQK